MMMPPFVKKLPPPSKPLEEVSEALSSRVSDWLYQHDSIVKQALNDIETGKRTGDTELVKAAEKRIAAAKAAKPQEK